ncbi:3-methyladenine DNA glycosylase [Cryobacterium sp. PH29-G1]|uniref:3-methyladenine DNA glycosylase n=1 Tax=Cryobacterium sp. PH29-G1 TaxID=3046211 RepID=UPI0024BA0112|nr:3-methyladenine DNA glycosylase [Cryobacterium sp. PH29-G1]MDJ0349709.1 3-methyladenine DNA glycosylase [Cryobacterium sp. PH29-G1]
MQLSEQPGTDQTRTLAATEWRALEQAHEYRADNFTRGRRERAATGQSHPVDDFLFTYYPFRPGLLRRWHPGAGVLLRGAANEPRASWKWYRTTGDASQVDAAAFSAKNDRVIRFVASLLSSTRQRPAHFGCFGLHEWAMVYRQGEHRHVAPLRLGQGDTDAVVDGNRIACSHFDAFRFFTPPAIGLNALQPSRENQPAMEQPGCLHAGMDIYKWVIKLGPLIPGELLLDAFELARDIRQLDMEASPYDLSDWGYTPVAVETAAGKAEYVRRQRDFTTQSNVLRDQVVALLV